MKIISQKCGEIKNEYNYVYSLQLYVKHLEYRRKSKKIQNVD